MALYVEIKSSDGHIIRFPIKDSIIREDLRANHVECEVCSEQAIMIMDGIPLCSNLCITSYLAIRMHEMIYGRPGRIVPRGILHGKP